MLQRRRVVRGREVELTDDNGVVRFRAGFLGTDRTDTAIGEVWGLEVYDEWGRARLAMQHCLHGAVVALKFRGNQVLVVGVNDPAPDVVVPGPYVVLCDPDGEPIERIHAAETWR